MLHKNNIHWAGIVFKIPGETPSDPHALSAFSNLVWFCTSMGRIGSSNNGTYILESKFCSDRVTLSGKLKLSSKYRLNSSSNEAPS